MSLRLAFCCCAFVCALVFAAQAHAQTFGRTEVLLTPGTAPRGMTLYSSGALIPQVRQPGLDYALFATELVAYLTKEVLPDSSDEYDNSLLGSKLTRSMPPAQSEFGSHCLTIVRHLGSLLPLSPSATSLAVDQSSTLGYLARAAAGGLALRQIWSAFQNDVEGNRAGVSLNPKVSARRFGVNVTLHW
jgi:hypothetical protein